MTCHFRPRDQGEPKFPVFAELWRNTRHIGLHTYNHTTPSLGLSVLLVSLGTSSRGPSSTIGWARGKRACGLLTRIKKFVVTNLV